MSIPQEVLGDALAAAIGGRRVRTAVFTTFSFDPGFFELHILPLLFHYPFSQVDKVKRIQLEDQLRSTDVAVYYDRSALAQDALPAQLDFRRIDVRRRGGVFHPKLVLLLVENPPQWEDEEGSGPQSLVVGTLSANLTRAGWWENVETGHFEEIPDLELSDSPCPFRQDLLKLIGRLKTTAAPDENHAALEEVHAFIRNRTSTNFSVPTVDLIYRCKSCPHEFCIWIYRIPFVGRERLIILSSCPLLYSWCNTLCFPIPHCCKFIDSIGLKLSCLLNCPSRN